MEMDGWLGTGVRITTITSQSFNDWSPVVSMCVGKLSLDLSMVMNASMFHIAGWPNGIQAVVTMCSLWLHSCGCRMDGLMEQTVVTMCSLDGSTVAGVGWMASWNRS